VLRKYPQRAPLILPAISKVIKTTSDGDAKVAVIWLLGEFGESISEAPYVLEPLIDDFNNEKDSSIRLELLTASVKLFFKRPPEMQKLLGQLLAAAIASAADTHVRDRALFYYRLLRVSVQEVPPSRALAKRHRLRGSSTLRRTPSSRLRTKTTRSSRTRFLTNLTPSLLFLAHRRRGF
jgi:vesicle coat complex subunit